MEGPAPPSTTGRTCAQASLTSASASTAPDTDSGTFDYFTEEINGEAQVSRADYTASADDNVLVQGIAGDRGSSAISGTPTTRRTRTASRLSPSTTGDGCVTPEPSTIEGRLLQAALPAALHLRQRREHREARGEGAPYLLHGPRIRPDPRGGLRSRRAQRPTPTTSLTPDSRDSVPPVGRWPSSHEQCSMCHRPTSFSSCRARRDEDM